MPKIRFVVSVHFTNGDKRLIETLQRSFDGARAVAQSKFFWSIREGKVSLIAVKVKGAE